MPAKFRSEKRADGFSPPAHHTFVLTNAARGESRIAQSAGPGHGGVELGLAGRTLASHRSWLVERPMIQSDRLSKYGDFARPVLHFNCSISSIVAPFG
jgi:hypothetical protein